jgi:hypothetical protein
MKILKLQERRGISTFIAVLLMMVLAVSAGVVIYSYTMGFLGGLGGTQTPGAMSLDTAKCDGTTHVLTAYVRNIGKGSIDFDEAYVDGVQVPSDNFTASPDLLTEGSVSTVTITYWSFTAPNTYEIKLVAADNTQLAFNVKCE